MERFEELSLEEMQEVAGGILPLLALVVVFTGDALAVGCLALAGDIIINWESYNEALNSKLDNCK